MKNPPFVSSSVLAAAGSDGTLELTIYGDIGENFWTGEGITPASVKQQIDKAGKYARMSVRINSPGGNAFDGVAIHNVLRAAGKPVSVFVDGIAASAASIIAMAGDTITMGTGAMLMLHNPWVITMGGAPELRKQADVLDQIADSMSDIYARSGKPKEEIRTIMDEETWMSAQDAVDLGFATDIAAGSAKALAAAKEFSLLAQMKNVPEALKLAQTDEAVASEAAQAGPPAESITVLRERFKITHKRRK